MVASDKSITAIHAQRDFVRILRDVAKEGAQEPEFEVLVKLWPCNIQYIGGDETVRGRQIEGHLTALITGTWDFLEYGRLKPQMRVEVVEGMVPGSVFNIVYVNPGRFIHRSYFAELLVRELDGEDNR